MNKAISKWPSRALNLLVVLSMVIALCIVLAPPMVAQEECNPTEPQDGCNLVVDVRTYTKDANGDFDLVTSVGAYDCYYVNAVVVNNGNDTAGNLTANLVIGGTGGASLDSSCVQENPQSWADQIIPGDDLLAGEVADFWWKVCCNGIGTATFTVTASANGGACQDTDGTSVTQGVTTDTKCVEIKIVEAPGLPDQTGRLLDDNGDPVVYHSAMPDPVTPCTNFGIKAEITNLCSIPLYNVNGTITISDYASLVGGDPSEWSLGTIEYLETELVAWTVHCDSPGDAVIWVKAKAGITDLHLTTTYINDPVTVHQLGAGELLVEIIEPEDCTKIPQGDACGDNIFPIEVKVTNNRDQDALSVFVTIAGNDSALLSFVNPPGTIASLGDLEPGEVAYADFLGRCKDNGSVLLTATATAGGLDPVYDTQVVSQNDVIAEVLSVTARDPGGYYWVNVCQKFDVIADFSNYSGAGRIFQTYIYWTGNATLLFGDGYDPQFDRQLGQGWRNFGQDGSLAVNTVVGGNESAGWYNYQTPPTICDCCDTQVRWTFQCTGTEDVQIYVKMVDALTGITYVDDSFTCPGVTNVYQEWKAHLIAGVTAFIQDDCGVMLNRTAFAPGQDFHVVIPVINTGDAAAENVVVTYLVSGSGAYTYISTSGDAVSGSFAGGVGTVNLGTISHDQAKKAILQFHCTGEGSVSILITGMSGIDENTNKAIAENNKIYPICPTLLKQIPFTVVIQNPETCQNFKVGANFAVKALISNDSTFDLGNVSATVYWESAGILYAGAALVQSQTQPKDLGNATDHSVLAGTQHEITWEFECTAPGDVTFWVTTTALTPYLTAISDEVTVHQLDCIDIGVEIVSPDQYPNYEDDWEYTAIATGEEFAVTALVNCTGSAGMEAENVQACIDYDTDMLELVDNAPPCKPVGTGTMVDEDQAIVTWTLRALSTEATECYVADARINVTVTTTSEECTEGADPNTDYVYVTIYPAAHLEADIESITPVSPFMVGTEFQVKYRVYNRGEADAWEVEAALSVDPAGSVRVAAGDSGYTQYLGNITGWSYYGGGYSYVEKTFTLHCTEVGLSTITITPKGNDECGWHTVFVQDSDHWQAEYEWFNYPGREIDPEFIEPVSQTVKQVEFVPAEPDTSITTYDIELVSGWNLISLPLIPDDSDIADAFATIWPNFNRAAMFDDGGFKTYIKGGGAQGFTTVSPEFGYWVLMNASDTLTVTGQFQNDPPSLPAEYEVVQGWNLIGFHSVAGQTAGDYLAALTANGVPTWAKMWGYNGQWSPVGVNGTMNPGQGYWLAVTAADGGTIYP